MLKCTVCGAINPAGSKFCTQCGATLIANDSVDRGKKVLENSASKSSTRVKKYFSSDEVHSAKPVASKNSTHNFWDWLYTLPALIFWPLAILFYLVWRLLFGEFVGAFTGVCLILTRMIYTYLKNHPS